MQGSSGQGTSGHFGQAPPALFSSRSLTEAQRRQGSRARTPALLQDGPCSLLLSASGGNSLHFPGACAARHRQLQSIVTMTRAPSLTGRTRGRKTPHHFLPLLSPDNFQRFGTSRRARLPSGCNQTTSGTLLKPISFFTNKRFHPIPVSRAFVGVFFVVFDGEQAEGPDPKSRHLL